MNHLDDIVVGATVAACFTYVVARRHMHYTLAMSIALFTLPVTAPLGTAMVAATRRGFREMAPAERTYPGALR